MKRVVQVFCGLFAFAGLLMLVADSADALPKFKAAFDEAYVKNSNNEDFQAAFKKASCNTCHVKGEKKNVRNHYGEELAKLIEGDASDRIKKAAEGGDDAKAAEEAKVLKELEAAFKKVESVKSNPKDKSSPTYGELFKSGKLPE